MHLFTRQNSNTELYLQNCIVRFGWDVIQVRQLYWFQDWLVETQILLTWVSFISLPFFYLQWWSSLPEARCHMIAVVMWLSAVQ